MTVLEVTHHDRMNTLGQVTSAVRKWSDGTPVAGQDYSFAFDDIGTRKTATLNSNVSEYAANLLNQCFSRGGQLCKL